MDELGLIHSTILSPHCGLQVQDCDRQYSTRFLAGIRELVSKPDFLKVSLTRMFLGLDESTFVFVDESKVCVLACKSIFH